MHFDWETYSLQWLSVVVGLAFVSPLLIATIGIMQNGAETNVKLKG